MATARRDSDEAVQTLTQAIDAFFVARRPRKDSPHTDKAYAGDLRAIGELLARAANTPVDRLTVDDLTVPRLRSAFAQYAEATRRRRSTAAGRPGTSCSPSSSPRDTATATRCRPSPRPNCPAVCPNH